MENEIEYLPLEINGEEIGEADQVHAIKESISSEYDEFENEEDSYFRKEAEISVRKKEYNVGRECGLFFHKLANFNDATVNAISADICPLSGMYFAAVGYSDGLVRLWNVVTMELLETLVGHTKAVNCIISVQYNNVAYVVSGSADSTCIIWDSSTRKIHSKASVNEGDIFSLASGRVSSVAGGIVVASGEFTRQVVLWNFTTGETLRVFKGLFGGCVYAVAIYEGDSINPTPLLITGSGDCKLAVWDLMTGEVKQVLTGHVWPIMCLSLYIPPNGKGLPLVITGACDKSIIVWDLETGKSVRKIMAHKGFLSAIKVIQPVNLDTPYIISCCREGDVVMTDLYTGREMRRLSGPKSVQYAGLAVLEEKEFIGPTVLLGGADGHVHVWNLHRSMPSFNIKRGHPLEVTHMQVYSSRTSAEESLIATAGREKHIVLWTLGGRRVRVLEGHNDTVFRIHFSQRSPHSPAVLFSASWDRSCIMWDPFTGVALHTFRADSTGGYSCLSTITYKNHWYLAVGTFASKIDVFDIDEGSLLVSHKAKGDLHSVHLFESSVFADEDPASNSESVSNLHLAYGTSSLHLEVIEAISGEAVSTLAGVHKDTVCQIAVVALHVYRRQYLVAASWDETFSIWNISTGELVRLVKHQLGGLISIKIYCQPNDASRPLLATGSADTTICIWDLYNGDLLNTLEGHATRIVGVDVVTLPGGEVSLVSCSYDFSVVIWDNSYDSAQIMPPRGTALWMFDLDCAQNNGYQRMKNLYSKFGLNFFLDNSILFSYAISGKHQSFITTFKREFANCVRRLRQRIAGVDPLRYTIHMQDVSSMKLLLAAWSMTLNQRVSDSAEQRLFHLSYFIDKEILFELADRYPNEFERFICSLTLVQADSSVNVNFPAYQMADHIENRLVSAKRVSNVSANDVIGYFDRTLVRERAEDGQPVTAMFVPLQDLCDVSMLQVFVNVSKALDSVSIFNSDLGDVGLTSIWRTRGKRSHIISFGIYIAYTCTVAVSVYSFSFLSQFSEASRVVMWIIQVAVVVFNLYYILQERKQMMIEQESFVDHFMEMWNTFDMVTYCSSLIGILIRMYYLEETIESQCLLAVCSVFTWVKMLYYLRAFMSSGPLVSMIFQIASDIKYFLLVLFIVLSGFAQGFFALSSHHSDLPFGTVRGAFLNSFVYMLGGFDTTFEDSISRSFSIVLLVMFILFMSILMLNLLIALMGQSFQIVNEKGLGQWRYELASILLEQKHLNRIQEPVPSCTLVLKYTSDLTSDDICEDLRETPLDANRDSKVHLGSETSSSTLVVTPSSDLVDEAATGSSKMEEVLLKAHELTQSSLLEISQEISTFEDALADHMPQVRREMEALEARVDQRISSLEKKLDLLLRLAQED